MKFVFLSGWRKVTVRASDFHEADLRARGVLDDRCEKANREPPVGWTLELAQQDGVEITPYEKRQAFIKKHGFVIVESDMVCSCGFKIAKNFYNKGALFPYLISCTGCSRPLPNDFPGEQI